MRSALFTKLPFLLLLVAVAHCQGPPQMINPHTQIRWPISCTNAKQAYSYNENKCLTVGPVGAGNGEVQINVGGVWTTIPGFSYDVPSNTLHAPNIMVPGAANIALPPGNVTWPPTCTSGVYSPATNSCVAPGTAANPAGTAGQLQYNNGGIFGAIPNSSVDSLGNAGFPGVVVNTATVMSVGGTDEGAAIKSVITKCGNQNCRIDVQTGGGTIKTDFFASATGGGTLNFGPGVHLFTPVGGGWGMQVPSNWAVTCDGSAILRLAPGAGEYTHFINLSPGAPNVRVQGCTIDGNISGLSVATPTLSAGSGSLAAGTYTVEIQAVLPGGIFTPAVFTNSAQVVVAASGSITASWPPFVPAAGTVTSYNVFFGTGAAGSLTTYFNTTNTNLTITTATGASTSFDNQVQNFCLYANANDGLWVDHNHIMNCNGDGVSLDGTTTNLAVIATRNAHITDNDFTNIERTPVSIFDLFNADISYNTYTAVVGFDFIHQEADSGIKQGHDITIIGNKLNSASEAGQTAHVVVGGAAGGALAPGPQIPALVTQIVANGTTATVTGTPNGLFTYEWCYYSGLTGVPAALNGQLLQATGVTATTWVIHTTIAAGTYSSLTATCGPSIVTGVTTTGMGNVATITAANNFQNGNYCWLSNLTGPTATLNGSLYRILNPTPTSFQINTQLAAGTYTGLNGICGGYWNSSSHFTVRDNHSYGACGIAFLGSMYDVFDGNTDDNPQCPNPFSVDVSNSVITNNIVSYGPAVYVGAGNTNAAFTISTARAGQGVTLGVGNNTIKNNHADCAVDAAGNVWGPENLGMFVYGSGNSVIEGNSVGCVSGGYGYGILVNAYSVGGTIPANIIRANYITDQRPTPTMAHGLVVDHLANVNVGGNVIAGMTGTAVLDGGSNSFARLDQDGFYSPLSELLTCSVANTNAIANVQSATALYGATITAGTTYTIVARCNGTNWVVASQVANQAINLTTTGSGAATYSAGVLNIPTPGTTAITFRMPGSPLANTGSTTNNYMGTITIPAGAMCSTCALEIITRLGACTTAVGVPAAPCTGTANTGTCTINGYYSSTSGATGTTAYMIRGPAVAAATAGYSDTTTQNVSAASQVSDTFYDRGVNPSTQATGISTINTANAWYINLFLQNSVAADNCFIDSAWALVTN